MDKSKHRSCISPRYDKEDRMRWGKALILSKFTKTLQRRTKMKSHAKVVVGIFLCGIAVFDRTDHIERPPEAPARPQGGASRGDSGSAWTEKSWMDIHRPCSTAW